MGKNSYLGGSTVIHIGSGWFSRERRAPQSSAPADDYTEALAALRIEQQGYAAELAALSLTQKRERFLAEIDMALKEGRDIPEIELGGLLEIGEIGRSLIAYRLRFPKKSADDIFNPRQIRIDARHAYANKLFLISIPQASRARRNGVFLLGGKVTRVLGLYPNVSAIQEEAACNGWLVTHRDLADASDLELRRVWGKRPHPKAHPLWS